MEWIQLPHYKQKALEYAEEVGIIEYKVVNNKMIYYANYPTEHTTYKVTIELDNNEDTRERVSKYYKKQ